MFKSKVGLIGLGQWGKNIYRNLETFNVIEKVYDNSSQNLLKSVTNKTDKYWLEQVGFEINNEGNLCIVVSSDFIKSSIEKKVYSKIKSVYQLNYNKKACLLYTSDAATIYSV